jgi:hypothetical protein
MKFLKFLKYYLFLTIFVQLGWIAYIVYKGGIDRFIHNISNGSLHTIANIFAPLILSPTLLIAVLFYLSLAIFIPGATHFLWFFKDATINKNEKEHNAELKKLKNSTEHKLSE